MVQSVFEPAGQEDPLAVRSGTSPRVSVVICTKDRPEDLAQAIASVRASGEAGQRGVAGYLVVPALYP
jgi:Flp pilus assembly protein TadB